MTIITESTAITTAKETTTERRPPVGGSGFSLVELLVAMSVVVVFLLLVVQMVSSTSTVTSGVKRRLDADAEARSVFDRLAVDISQMVIRADVDSIFIGSPLAGAASNDLNDQFYFFSQSPGYATSSTAQSLLSLVGYRVRNRQLERLGVQRSWDELTFLTTNSARTGFDPQTLAQTLDSLSNNFRVISPSVFRMEAALLMKPGTTNADGTVNQANSYARLTDPLNPRRGLGNVAAIVVALGILDQGSRAAVPGSQMDSTATLLPDSTTNGGIPLTQWGSNIISAGGIPPVVRAKTRLYIRHFPLKR